MTPCRVPVFMMGAPTVMLEKLPQGEEAIAALHSLEAYMGRKVDAVMCVEAGGLNSTIPVCRRPQPQVFL